MQLIDKCYSDSAQSETMVKRWYADFKDSRTDANDAKHSGRPNSAVIPENTKTLHQLVLADCKLKLREIAEGLKISGGSVFTIWHKHLLMRRLCSKWVLCLLIVNQKQQCIDDSDVFFNCFNARKKRFYVNM